MYPLQCRVLLLYTLLPDSCSRSSLSTRTWEGRLGRDTSCGGGRGCSLDSGVQGDARSVGHSVPILGKGGVAPSRRGADPQPASLASSCLPSLTSTSRRLAPAGSSSSLPPRTPRTSSYPPRATPSAAPPCRRPRTPPSLSTTTTTRLPPWTTAPSAVRRPGRGTCVLRWPAHPPSPARTTPSPASASSSECVPLPLERVVRLVLLADSGTPCRRSSSSSSRLAPPSTSESSRPSDSGTERSPSSSRSQDCQPGRDDRLGHDDPGPRRHHSRRRQHVEQCVERPLSSPGARRRADARTLSPSLPPPSRSLLHRHGVRPLARRQRLGLVRPPFPSREAERARLTRARPSSSSSFTSRSPSLPDPSTTSSFDTSTSFAASASRARSSTRPSRSDSPSSAASRPSAPSSSFRFSSSAASVRQPSLMLSRRVRCSLS